MRNECCTDSDFRHDAQECGWIGDLPAFGAAYSDVEIAAVANYVTERFGSVASHMRPQQIRLLRSESSQ
jgi:mono/diheme cytochrome c family protein